MADPTGLIGRQIGPYLIADRIGEGGMGAVYAAVDLGLKRRVALKVLHPALAADPGCRDRFVREAQAAARLSHPNIVHVYFAGTDADVTFIALELVDGSSVGALLRRRGGPLGRRRALRIARDAAAALGAAHAHGIVHRDVKPDNILVAGDAVKLTDFGIARVRSSPRITDHGAYVGTPRYSSPEQCRSAETDARSDLYSLGVVLYEMLTGDVPHAATTPLALLSKIASEPPRPIRELVPGLPDAIVALVHRLLEKEPAARPATAADLGRELEAAIADLPESAVEAAIDVDGPTGAAAPESARVLALLESGTAVGTGAGPASDTLSGRGTGVSGPALGGSPVGPPLAIVATPPVAIPALGLPVSADAPTYGGTTPASGRPLPGPISSRREPVSPVAPRAPTPPTSYTPSFTPARRREADTLSASETLSPANAALTVLGRLAVVDRLATAGVVAEALRLAGRVARDLAGDPALGAIVAAQAAAARAGAPAGALGDPVAAALARIRAALEAGAPLRPTAGLRAALADLRRLPGAQTGAVAAEIAERVERAAAATPVPGPGAGAAPGLAPGLVHFVACLGLPGPDEAALAVPWKWDEPPPTHAASALALDEDGRSQVEAAATVLLGLSPAVERRAVRAFHEARAAVAVPPVSGLGQLEGRGAGLPALLAMVAARLDAEPSAGVAAFGALDPGTIPPLPAEDRSDPGIHARFLNVRLAPVPRPALKARAALEQRPAVRRIIVPEESRADVEADADLGRDLAAASVSIVPARTVGDALAAALLPRAFGFAPLGRAPSSETPVPGAMEPAPGAVSPEAVEADERGVRRALALARLILAGVVGLAIADAFGLAAVLGRG